MKVAIILGTRPEIIKMSPVIRYCQNNAIDFYVIHTNQHYSSNMDEVFFRELELPLPDYNLNVGSGSHGEQTGKMLMGIERILQENRPGVVLVQGDTNTVLAGALAASKLHIKVGHVEAGLRSFDRSMPEETNRVIVDHIADYLFVPTEVGEQYLKNEGIDDQKIIITGNTIVDALYFNIRLAEKKSTILKQLQLSKSEYFVLTLHRAENIDNQAVFANIWQGIIQVTEQYQLPIIFPIHPRTKKVMDTLHLSLPGNIRLIEPVGYFDFLNLLSHSRLVLTDSGGIQEESAIINIPCVTIRENTERPETIEIESNILAGNTPQGITQAVETMLQKNTNWHHPYGDGNAAQKIIKALIN